MGDRCGANVGVGRLCTGLIRQDVAVRHREIHILCSLLVIAHWICCILLPIQISYLLLK